MIFRNRITVLLFVVIIGVIVIGCNIGNNLSDSTNVTIDLGNPKVLGVSSVMVTISGEGMDTITKEFTYDTPTDTTWTIKIEVPQGSARKFEVTASVPNSVNAILGYYGSSTADISEENKTVTVHMGISRMKIITPNPNDGGGGIDASLIVMDDINGTSWQRITSSDLNLWGPVKFMPWDVDVDQSGNIIVVNNDSTLYQGGDTGRLWMITSFTPTISYTVLQDLTGGPPLVAVAVDRQNSKIYYASGDTVYWCGYTPFGTSDTVTTDYSPIEGLAVDEGFLYIASDTKVIKYDLGQNSESTSVTITGGTTAVVEDVMVKGDYVYVADSANKQIVRLNKSDLSYAGSYTGPTSGLYGPRRFVGTLNEGICFIDETDECDDGRVVYIKDIDGTVYTTYGTFSISSSDIGSFSFYPAPGGF